MRGSSYKVLYWLLVSCLLELSSGHTETSEGSNYCMLPLDVCLSLLLPWNSISNFLLLLCGERLSPNSIFSVLSKRLKNCFSHRLICPDPFSVLVSTVFSFLSALGFSWKQSAFLTPLPWSPCCQALSLSLKCWAPFPGGWNSPFFFIMCFWSLSALGCSSQPEPQALSQLSPWAHAN